MATELSVANDFAGLKKQVFNLRRLVSGSTHKFGDIALISYLR